jgi:hypothetical protein
MTSRGWDDRHWPAPDLTTVGGRQVARQRRERRKPDAAVGAVFLLVLACLISVGLMACAGFTAYGLITGRPLR